MKHEDSGYGGPPSRHSSASTTTRPDEEDDYLGSSTSTAGPPPDTNLHTGRFTRPQWSLATGAHPGSGADSAASSCSTHTLKINTTESYHPGAGPNDSATDSNHLRGSNSRTMSNTSVSVSPMGSSTPQEWGRSFRLFNTSRFFPAASVSRQRDGSMSQMYRNTLMHQRNGRGSSVGPDGERPLLNTSMSPPRQGSFVGVFNNQPGRVSFWPPDSSASGMLTAASPFGGYNTASTPAIGSPMLGLSRYTNTSFSNRPGHARHAVHRAVASCAMGNVLCTPSQPQVDLPLAMNRLRAHIALTGTTIIRGDAARPMEIKKGPLIGAGGFAKVFAGVNTVRGELVAIKEIDITDVDDVAALNEIESEFALLRSLHDPNVVSYSLFEHSKSQKVCRIVMELLAGSSTLYMLQKFGTMTEAVLRIMTKGILQAIRCIHKEGIFHRDIKPANILVSHRGEVKLCDFGCSKRVTELNKAASCIIGTPVYMAPEFIKGEADHKTDIWSMACSIFELSTGLQPWYHSGVRDNLPLMFYITTTYDSPMVFPNAEMRAEFSPEFLNFMDLCFTRNVANRPEAAELLKHPWILGTRLPVVAPVSNVFLALHQDSLFAQKNFGTPVKSSTFSSPRESAVDHDDASLNESDGLQKSASTTQTVNAVDEEVACQQELEAVAAATAFELCAALVETADIGQRSNAEPATVDAASGTGDTSPSLTRTLSIPSPALSHRGPVSVSIGDYSSPVYTPEHSMVHDNFYYNQISLGASGGNFVLPTGLDLDGAPPLQQYLRINEDGNLDMVHLPDDELEESVLQRTHISESGYGGALHPGRVVSPARTGSFYRGNVSPRATTGHTGDGTFSPLLPIGSTFSRGESTSRGGTSVPTSPQVIPAPPLLFRPAPLVTMLSQPDSRAGSPLVSHLSPTSASKAGSHRDAATPHTPRSESSTSLRRSESFRGLPEKLKPQADGRLHMSFSVSTAPGHAVNVELNVDVADVQCKVVDNQPNFVVAFTDDVRSQITNRIKEVSALSSPTTHFSVHPFNHVSPGSTSASTVESHPTIAGSHLQGTPPHRSPPRPIARPLSRPLSRVSAASASHLFATRQDSAAPSQTPSADGSSGTSSLSSSPVARIGPAHPGN